MLNDTAHERCELRFLPPLSIAQLSVDEVQTLEWMVVYDATEEMDAAVFACVALNCRGWVNDVEFVAVGGDGKGIDWNHADDRE